MHVSEVGRAVQPQEKCGAGCVRHVSNVANTPEIEAAVACFEVTFGFTKPKSSSFGDAGDAGDRGIDFEGVRGEPGPEELRGTLSDGLIGEATMKESMHSKT